MSLDVDIAAFLSGIKLQEVCDLLTHPLTHSHTRPQYTKPLLEHGITTASGLIGVSSGELAGYGVQASHVRQILRIVTILSGKVPDADAVQQETTQPQQASHTDE